MIRTHNKADDFRFHNHKSHISHWSVDPQFDEMGMVYFDWFDSGKFVATMTGHKI